jgi:DNA mismatch repair protein MutS2
MTSHALEVLEFERVLEQVAHRAASDVGRSRILALRPLHDRAAVERELERVAAVIRFVEAAPSFSPGPIPDITGEASQLAVEGAVLDPLGIHRVGRLLGASRLVSTEVGAHDDAYPEIQSIVSRLVVRKELEAAIERCVDEDGEVLGSASSELQRVRGQLRGAHARIVRKLETYLGSLPERFVVADGSITIRDGRYVIPVRREGKREVGGIVHDESQTGATLYIEPPVAIEAMNRLRELEREEAREIRRVLGEMTVRIAGDRHEIAGAFDALADFDSLHARARTARAWDAVPPTVAPAADSWLELHEARHPLLVEAGDGPVVPYDLTLEPDERCLVVTGPNTGGKSVFLKATGLIAALAQSGIVPPVGPGTRIPVFSAFFADIGDEQSIARNLSTFSAHLSNLSEIVSHADAGALVLIDEMGTGTDPSEGAALSRAIIEELVRRGARAIVSSHLGELKQLDTEGSGIVNASLQFDAERMEPTYRLVKGRPGRSYGLAIARRLGLPAEVLDRADRYRDEGAARLEGLLERLERKEGEVERLLEELDLERARTERLRSEVEHRERSVEEAERTVEDRAHADARQILLEARSEVEDAIRDLRGGAERGLAVEEAAREARRRVEMAADRHREEARRAEPRPGGSTSTDLRAGERVRIRSTGARGLVLELREERGLVEVGAMRLEVALDELERIEGVQDETSGTRRARGGWTGPPREQARLEVDLRGMRVDEMELELSRALDRAVLDDLGQLRIIHGKGTGALRQRVGEMLTDDARVSEFRMGGPGEGGAGVTVASFGGPA